MPSKRRFEVKRKLTKTELEARRWLGEFDLQAGEEISPEFLGDFTVEGFVAYLAFVAGAEWMESRYEKTNSRMPNAPSPRVLKREARDEKLREN